MTLVSADGEWQVEVIVLDSTPTLRVRSRGAKGWIIAQRLAGYVHDPSEVEQIMGRDAFASLTPVGVSS